MNATQVSYSPDFPAGLFDLAGSRSKEIGGGGGKTAKKTVKKKPAVKKATKKRKAGARSSEIGG